MTGKWYAIGYKVEVIERKDPIKQLEQFSDLLNETKVLSTKWH